MTVEELQVIVTASTRDLQRQMQDVTRQLQGVQRQTTSMSRSITNAFSGIKKALVGLGVGKAIKSMFDLSRTYEASVQQVNRIFRDNASAIEAWIDKNATMFGMARADAMQYASIYGNLVSGFEKDTKRMSEYTTQLMEATSIIASSTGRTVTDVAERIRSGLLGNTESIEDLGVNVNVALLETTNAFKTLANGRSWEQLSFQTQQQIRLMAILEQTSAKFGSSIQQNTNYQLMQLTANLKNIGLNLGNAFMPIVSVVLPVLNSMALALANVTNKIAAFMNALFGTNFNAGAGEVQQVAANTGDAAGGYQDMADAADGAADSADKAGKGAKKAAKDAKNALMGFDEVNQLQKDSGSDSGGSGGSGGGGGAGGISDTGTVVSTVMSQAAESFADKVKDVMDILKGLFQEGFEIGLGDDFEDRVNDIKESIEGIKTSLKDIFTDSEVVAAASRLAAAIALNLGKVAGSAVSIGTTIAQNLLGGIDKYLAQNKEYIKDRLVGIMNATADIANLAGDFAVAFADIFTVFGGETGQQCTANIIGIFENAFLGSLELALKFGRDILECITQPIIENKDKIKLAIENSLQVFESLSGTVKDAVTHLFEQAISVYDEYIDPAFERIKNGISEVLGAILDAYNTYVAPMLQKWADEFRGLYEEHLQPVMDRVLEIVGKLAELLSMLWESVLAPIADWLIQTLAPALTSALDIIWGAIAKVVEFISDSLNDILEILEGLIDFVTGVFTGDWERAWQGIQEVVSGAGGLIYDLTIGALLKIVEWLAGSFISAWNGAVEGIKNFFSPLANWFVSSVWTPLKTHCAQSWEQIKTGAGICWQNIQTAWNAAGSWWEQNVATPFKQHLSKSWGEIKTGAGVCWGNVKSAWSSAKSWWQQNVSDPIGQKMASAWDKIGQKGASAWTKIKDGCRSAVNGIIDHINGLIRKLNSIGFDMPKELGGGHIGFSIPTIPRLARGGIVDGATNFGNFIAGEEGKEMVVPLENTSFTDKIATAMGQAVMNAMSVMLNSNGMTGSNGQNVSLEMDGTVFARSMAPYMIKEFKRLGFELD